MIKLNMDFHAERRAIEEMKAGDKSKFVLLFDAHFADLYRYVARRVSDIQERERIVKVTFLEALGQVEVAPTDVSFLVWLYSLARPRIWKTFDKGDGTVSTEHLAIRADLSSDDQQAMEEMARVLQKLSLEEREILRLKFFEQVSDGDAMVVLGMEEGNIGTKVYRVLKRVHFLLFGNGDGKTGAYFSEVNRVLEQVRALEAIEVPEAFRLNMRVELQTKIQQKDFAIEAETVEEKPDFSQATGSNDPAKIFVEAVREMREEEEQERVKEEKRLERRESMFAFFEKWKFVLPVIPALLFIAVVSFVGLRLFESGIFQGGPVERGFATTCGIEVEFEGTFSDRERRNVNRGVSNRICDYYEVEKLLISRTDVGMVNVEVDVPDWLIQYEFVKKLEDWRIKKYERAFNSNGESRKV